MNLSETSSPVNNPLPSEFFFRSADKVARDLVGKGLVIGTGIRVLQVELVEVEAYLGPEDPASHAFLGLTKRNWPMFERGGICYVYLSYGINFCMNVSTGKEGEGQAVLFRAAIPIKGIPMMTQRRRGAPIRNLLSGPGKLTQALGIDLTFNGREFGEQGFQIVDLGKRYSRNQIELSPRIGISKAQDFPLRFTLKGSEWLSRR